MENKEIVDRVIEFFKAGDDSKLLAFEIIRAITGIKNKRRAEEIFWTMVATTAQLAIYIELLYASKGFQSVVLLLTRLQYHGGFYSSITEIKLSSADGSFQRSVIDDFLTLKDKPNSVPFITVRFITLPPLNKESIKSIRGNEIKFQLPIVLGIEIRLYGLVIDV